MKTVKVNEENMPKIFGDIKKAILKNSSSIPVLSSATCRALNTKKALTSLRSGLLQEIATSGIITLDMRGRGRICIGDKYGREYRNEEFILSGDEIFISPSCILIKTWREVKEKNFFIFIRKIVT